MLISLTSQAVQQFIATLTEDPGTGVWTGGHQAAGHSEPAQDWVWLDGSPVTADIWSGEEPNNGGSSGKNEDCLDSSWSGGNDAPCSWGYTFICEKNI